ncbi:MAG TPA: hypothetical protein VGH61_08530 [Steroidobacteraceae bacterium]
MIYALTSVFGAPSIGLKCSRLEGRALCQVQQSSLFGIGGNSGLIPESEIVRARAERPAGGGGRRGGSYRLLLDLKSGGYPYPVLSDQSFGVVQAQADRLNGYLADPRATAIELRERLWLSVLVPFAPIALVLGICGVATLVRRRRHAGVADAAG